MTGYVTKRTNCASVKSLKKQTHGADSLRDGRQVHLLPGQGVGVALVDVVGVDLGAAAVLGTLPGHSHGGAVAAQQGDAGRSAGSRCSTQIHVHHTHSRRIYSVCYLDNKSWFVQNLFYMNFCSTTMLETHLPEDFFKRF